MKRWPYVLSEEETLDAVLEGASIARYGDGEFKLCHGSSIRSQGFSPLLGKLLRHILHAQVDGLLVGIPNLIVPTKPFWDQFRTPRITQLFDMKRSYASAFISRPDSAPWINCRAYWDKVERLWKGKAVTLVRGSGKSLTPDLLASAHSVREIPCARQHAFVEREELLKKIGKPSGPVLLCCGPTATVLAYDLAQRGIHGVDLGHLGMFYKRRDKPVAQALAEGRAEEKEAEA